MEGMGRSASSNDFDFFGVQEMGLGGVRAGPLALGEKKIFCTTQRSTHTGRYKKFSMGV